MPMTMMKAAGFAAAVLSFSPLAAAAQTAEGKSERAMPEKVGTKDGKSERAMPGQTTQTGTPPAKVERAMPTPEKK